MNTKYLSQTEEKEIKVWEALLALFALSALYVVCGIWELLSSKE